MTREPMWRRYLRFFGFRGVADLDDELRFHIEMRVRDAMARGMSEQEARAATAQRLGDLARARDACVTIATRRQRRMSRAQIVDAFIQDVKFAARSLGRQKGWTAVAVVTLALGIGANSAVFSVVNHLLLNPIPYPSADRVALIHQEPSSGNNTGMSVTMALMGRNVSAWRDNARSFESIEPYATNDVTIQRAGAAARIARTAAILPSFATFAGERPLVGRMFTESEAKGAASVVVLSEGVWRAEYGAERSAVGTTLTVDGKPMTVVGVMPGVFQLPRTSESDVDLWLPLDLVRSDDDALLAVGRLRPGVTRAAAAKELDAIANRDAVHGAKNARYTARVMAPAELIRVRDSLVMLGAAVGLVLLIACANVAHLLLARAATRTREMAIRAAVGAGTERLFRLLFTESMILSLAGCVGGLLVGWAGLHLLVAARPESLSELAAAKMDGMTLLVTAALSSATGIAFGLIGAVQAARLSTHDSLKAGSLAASPGRGHGRLRGLLVVTEMALCTMLLVGAALLLRSVIHLQTRELGFNPKGLYALSINLPERYKRPEIQAFFREFNERARQVPGVEGLALASAGPTWTAFKVGSLQLEGQPDPPAGETSFIPYNGVDANYFRLVGIRLVEGTTFTDTSVAAAQAIVNAGFAAKHWPGRSALGRKFRIVYSGQGQWQTIVGVAQNTLMRGLTRDASEPLVYLPGTDAFHPQVLARTAGDAKALAALAGLGASIDSRLPPPQITSAEVAMRKSIARPRFMMFLLMTFTMVAVGLAAIGLYGVLAYSVAQRTREIGIRIALGASRRMVARSVMQHGLALAGVGAVVGLAAARWGVKLLNSMLYGVQQTDAMSFAMGAIVIAVVAVAACLLPVRRALAVDPLIAMRAE